MKSLPRAKPGSPGTVSPGAWNLLVQTVEETVAKVARITPKSSPDIIHRASLTGFTSHLTRRQGNGGAGATEIELPFQIYDTGVAFVSRAGTFNGVHAELTQAATTDGTWRLYASIVINVTTGEITDSDVAWYSSAQTNTATNYYHLIGTGVVADTGATRTVTNFNYGPIFFLLRGDVEGDWTVDFF